MAEITLLPDVQTGRPASFKAELDGQVFEGEQVDRSVRAYIAKEEKKARADAANVRSSIRGWMSRATYRRKLAALGLVRQARVLAALPSAPVLLSGGCIRGN